MDRHLSNLILVLLLIAAAIVTPRVWEHFSASAETATTPPAPPAVAAKPVHVPTWEELDAQEARDRAAYEARYGKPANRAEEPRASWSITTADGRHFEGTGQPPADALR